MSLKNYNKKGVFDYDPTNVPYTTLGQLYNQYGENEKYQICAMWVHTSKEYGESPVFALADVLVNIPKHLTETVKEILKDSNTVDEIKAGEGWFNIYEYESHGKKCYSLNFCEGDNK